MTYIHALDVMMRTQLFMRFHATRPGRSSRSQKASATRVTCAGAHLRDSLSVIPNKNSSHAFALDLSELTNLYDSLRIRIEGAVDVGTPEL